MSNDDLLARLLGPGAPELSCEECFAQLDSYVELVLAGRDPAEDFESLRELVDGRHSD